VTEVDASFQQLLHGYDCHNFISPFVVTSTPIISVPHRSAAPGRKILGCVV